MDYPEIQAVLGTRT